MLGCSLGRIMGKPKIDVAHVADREAATEHPTIHGLKQHSIIASRPHIEKTPDTEAPSQYTNTMTRKPRISNLNKCKQRAR